MKSKVSELEKLEELILAYKSEQDDKKKNVLYLNLIEETLQYVKKIVFSMHPAQNNLTPDDLMQVGALGALKAIETYTVRGKGSFKTYATKYIKGNILHYLRDKVNIVKTSRYVTEHNVKIKEAIAELTTKAGNVPPTLDDIAKYANIPPEKVEEILYADILKNPISLDEKIYTSEGTETLADRIPTEQDDSFEEYYENKKIIAFALNKLNATDTHVIYRFYIEGATKKDIAKELEISQVQVARIIKRALVKMYNIIKNDLEKEDI